MNDILSVPKAEQVMRDPSASRWLKTALRTALERDPVDAVNDAFVLTGVLGHRLRDIGKRPRR
jgi:hypothetical protein